MHISRIILSAGIVAMAAVFAQADPILFVNDYEGFVEAAGDVQTIDFETLPDGSPSEFGVEITPEFNYTDQGVTFFSQAPRLMIVGSEETGFDLGAYPEQSNDPTRNWIIAEPVEPALALGYFFGGHSTLSAFDSEGALIETVTFAAGGPGLFLGIVVDSEIAWATADDGDNTASIDSFLFTPISEPATLILLTLGAVMVIRRRHRRIRAVGNGSFGQGGPSLQRWGTRLPLIIIPQRLKTWATRTETGQILLDARRSLRYNWYQTFLIARGSDSEIASCMFQESF